MNLYIECHVELFSNNYDVTRAQINILHCKKKDTTKIVYWRLLCAKLHLTTQTFHPQVEPKK